MRVPLHLPVCHCPFNTVGLQGEEVCTDAALVGGDNDSSPFSTEVADIMTVFGENVVEPLFIEPIVARVVIVVSKDVRPRACLVVDGVPEDGDEDGVPLAVDEGACVEIFLREMESDGKD